jgi:myosin heavy subunit
LFSCSALALQRLCNSGKNQSILVSGESGAGKTESVKLLMSHIATMSKNDQKTSSINNSSNNPFPLLPTTVNNQINTNFVLMILKKNITIGA